MKLSQNTVYEQNRKIQIQCHQYKGVMMRMFEESGNRWISARDIKLALYRRGYPHTQGFYHLLLKTTPQKRFFCGSRTKITGSSTFVIYEDMRRMTTALVRSTGCLKAVQFFEWVCSLEVEQ